MSRLISAGAVVVASVMLLTGCFSSQIQESTDGGTTSSTSSEPQASEQAPAGPVVEGTGFRFTAPDGWVEADPPPTGADVAAIAEDAGDDGFADNVNVVLAPSGLVSLDTVEEQVPVELTAGGATDLVVGDRVEVADTQAAHFTATANAPQGSYTVEQYVFSSSDQTYVVTFSFSVEVAPEDRLRVSDAVLATWAWS